MRLWIDFETRSTVGIDQGLDHYFSQAEMLLCAYAFDDGPVNLIEAHDAMPNDLRRALNDPTVEVWAFNVTFEHYCVKSFFDIDLPPERCFDVMLQAAEHGTGLLSLDTLCKLMKLPADKAKDEAGAGLIRLFCVPRVSRARDTLGQVSFTEAGDKPEEWEAFKRYCAQDVESMRTCAGMLPAHNYPAINAERRVAWADMRMNRRGVPVNIAFARKAAAYAEQALAQANEALVYSTNGRLTSITQRAKLLAYLNDNFHLGVSDTQATTLERLVSDDNPPELALVLDLALNNTTVTAKYKAAATLAVEFANAPGYGVVHNSFVLCGASRTRRWAGRGLQPQNFKRPKLNDEQIAEVRQHIMDWQPTEPTMHSVGEVADCIRSVIEAPPGYKIISGDLASIENRALMWLADCRHELDYFRQVDAGTAQFDPYEMTYANAFGVKPSEVDKKKRQVGKLMALLLQYLGGVGGLMQGVKNFRLNAHDLALLAMEASTDSDKGRAMQEWGFMLTKNMTYDLTEHDFCGLTILKNKWRDNHPEIVLLGKQLEQGFRECGYVNDKLSFSADVRFAYMRLPSGNVLGYPYPKLDDKSISIVTLLGKNITRTSYYAGKFLENAASGTSRDILAHALALAEQEALNPCSTIHDELLLCVPEEDDRAAGTLKACLTYPIPWAKGLPLDASVYEAKYFKKD